MRAIHDFNSLKIGNILSNTVYSLIIISIAFFLFSGQASRNAFYILTYISILIFIWLVASHDKKIYFYWIPTLFLMLGLSKWIWASITVNHQLPLIAEHYRISGKRMILGSFILYIIHRLSPNWQISLRMIKTGTTLSGIMLLVIATVNVYISIKTHERPKINSDAATSGAYMFTLLALVTLWSIRQTFLRHWNVPAMVVAGATFILLGASGTRSAIILFFLILIAYLFYYFYKGSWKVRVSGVVIIFALILTSSFFASKYSAALMGRVDSVQTEIEQYQHGNPSTSIGGRIGMWQAGIWAFTQHPWGQSADSRNQEAKTWIMANQPSNKIALWHIQYHTHNDLVESFSLQGIAGGIIMLTFFASLLLAPFTGNTRRYELLLLAIPVVYFSMGDSQFYNRESPYFIILLWGYFYMMRHAKICPDHSHSFRQS